MTPSLQMDKHPRTQSERRVGEGWKIQTGGWRIGRRGCRRSKQSSKQQLGKREQLATQRGSGKGVRRGGGGSIKLLSGVKGGAAGWRNKEGVELWLEKGNTCTYACRDEKGGGRETPPLILSGMKCDPSRRRGIFMIVRRKTFFVLGARKR